MRRSEVTRLVLSALAAAACASCGIGVLGALAAAGGGGGGGSHAASGPAASIAFVGNTDLAPSPTLFDLGTSDLGGMSVPLLAHSQTAGVTRRFDWAPDQTRLAYMADRNADGDVELIVSTPDGTSSLVLSKDLAAGESVLDFEWSPDSRRLAFLGGDVAGAKSLYVAFSDGRVDAGGKTAIVVSGSATSTKFVQFLPSTAFPNTYGFFGWRPTTDPSQQRIYYVADETTDGVFDLWVADPDAVASKVLVSDATGSVAFNSSFQLPISVVQWSPDGSHLAWIQDRNASTNFELFTWREGTPTSQRTSVSGPIGALKDVLWFDWSPNSRYLAYLADQLSDQLFEIFVVQDPDATSSGVKVSATGGSKVVFFNGGNGKQVFQWEPSPLTANPRLAYLADETTDSRYDLYVVDWDGSHHVGPLSNAIVAGGRVDEFEWAPDAHRIAYAADETVDQTFKLYTVPPDGSGARVEVSSIGPTSSVRAHTLGENFRWSPDSSHLAYVADQEIDGTWELFVTLDASSTSSRVSRDFAPASPGIRDSKFEFVGTDLLVYAGPAVEDGAWHLFTSFTSGGPTGVVVPPFSKPAGLTEADFVQRSDARRHRLRE
jgi:Tol biopolymer transport system component